MPPNPAPYSMLTRPNVSSGNALGWTINPYQLNSSGILPGLTNISVAGSISIVNQNTGTPLMVLGTVSGQTAIQFFNASTAQLEFQAITNANGAVTWSWYDNSGNVVMYVGWLPVAQIFGWAVATPNNSLLGVV